VKHWAPSKAPSHHPSQGTVSENTESTQRQDALVQRASDLAWPADRVNANPGIGMDPRIRQTLLARAADTGFEEFATVYSFYQR
jgi:hypothetical protein